MNDEDRHQTCIQQNSHAFEKRRESDHVQNEIRNLQVLDNVIRTDQQLIHVSKFRERYIHELFRRFCNDIFRRHYCL